MAMGEHLFMLAKFEKIVYYIFVYKRLDKFSCFCYCIDTFWVASSRLR